MCVGSHYRSLGLHQGMGKHAFALYDYIKIDSVNGTLNVIFMPRVCMRSEVYGSVLVCLCV